MVVVGGRFILRLRKLKPQGPSQVCSSQGSISNIIVIICNLILKEGPPPSGTL